MMPYHYCTKGKVMGLMVELSRNDSGQRCESRRGRWISWICPWPLPWHAAGVESSGDIGALAQRLRQLEEWTEGPSHFPALSRAGTA